MLKLEAGKEQAVAATKTYVNSLGAIALLFATTTRRRPGACRARADSARRSRPRSSGRSTDAAASRRSRPASTAGTVVARGINYCTSFEIALKIRELSGLLFEAYSAADLMHGPVAAIGPGWPVFAIAPSGPALEAWRSAIADSRGAAPG